MPDQGGQEHQDFPENIPSLKRYELEEIAPNIVLQGLELDSDIISEDLRKSVQKSNWYSADKGKMIVEVRNPIKLNQSLQGLLYISDLDDTLLAATDWHAEEFSRLATNPKLLERGIKISPEQAEDLYEHSKITLPGISEPRYTPKINLILASLYAKAIERGEPLEQAREATLSALNSIKDELAEKGEISLDSHSLDEDVVACLIDNHTADFVYEHFARYFLEGTKKEDVRAILTRGKIEGPFGQVYKVHSAGLLDKGLGSDIVVYTNDLKADSLPILYQLIPESIKNGTRIFDDNPSEIDKYLSWAKEIGIRNLQVIGVRHPTAKRKNFLVSHQPSTTFGKEKVKFDLYFATSDAPGRIS